MMIVIMPIIVFVNIIDGGKPATDSGSIFGIYMVVIWPRFKQTPHLTKFPNFVVVHRTTTVIIFGNPTKFLVVHYFDPC